MATMHHVARLTRPQRIRCRPCLIFSPLQLAGRSYTLPAPRKHQRSDDYDRLRPMAGRGLEELDYEETLQSLDKPRIAKSRRSQNRLTVEERTQRKKLPSLSDPKSFKKSKKTGDAIEVPAAGPSQLSSGAREQPIPEELVQETPHAESSTTALKRAEIRRNAVGVQLLSPSLHSQLFPGPGLPQPPDRLLNISRDHLRTHGLSPEGAAILPEINFTMPPLRGRNVREHFIALGQETAEPYLSLAEEFVNAELPPMPAVWEMKRAGWTRYGRDESISAVPDLGDEKIVCFDVETLYKLSSYPVMATAATPNAWYSWLSPTLFEPPPSEPDTKREFWDTRTPPQHCHDLIPLFSGDHERIVVGHNVGYDRQRVKEEYDLSRTATRWLDTLSLHVATRGITSVQRPAWLKYKKNKAEKVMLESEAHAALLEEAEMEGDEEMLKSLSQWGSSGESDMEALNNRWEDVTAVNSLADVAALHCKIPVDKSIRDRFGDDVVTHASQLVPELHKLLTYCASDVHTTHEVYKKVLPLYRASCPHPATFAGVLAMASSFLPVNESWERYLKAAEEKYMEMDEGVRKALRVLAEKLRKEGKREGDVWAEQLDWTPKSARWTEPDSDNPVPPPPEQGSPPALPATPSPPSDALPAWYGSYQTDPSSLVDNKGQRNLLPLILRLSYKSHPVIHLREHLWCFLVPEDRLGDYIDAHGEPTHLGPKDMHLESVVEGYAIFRVGGPKEARKTKLTGPGMKGLLSKGELTSVYPDLLGRLVSNKADGVTEIMEGLKVAVEDMKKLGKGDIWGSQLDWEMVNHSNAHSSTSVTETGSPSHPTPSLSPRKSARKSKTPVKPQLGFWPKWYWDLTGPATSSKIPFGELDLTTKKTVAPLLLRLQWQNHPLIHSREHKWLYRVPKSTADDSQLSSAVSSPSLRKELAENHPTLDASQYIYCRLPHKDGEGKNVGNPLSKSFVKAIESGEMASEVAVGGDNTIIRQAAADATNMNVLCSYWMSSRERIKQQMVVFADEARTQGIILPQVITMGTVTRRAVESTWLTAANAKKNRVGSELKAMVRAPPGYAIVGADVDSEELWISSVMGDSQFGCHGATAIGWMTLEGTKSAGTDLHSKTASILGISRDAAKVFNYSRIYGAGQKHAVQLLLQGDASLTKEAAAERAKQLYKATKGTKANRGLTMPPAVRPSIWYGGSESFLFNTLEAIALSDRPTTPALGCGVTRALRKSYLEESSSYLPSRINWVVQSSGVDYLHLLIVSMEYLLKTYNISARYLISVHDEVRYLAKEEDRYRCALALQIANAWTRALFCFNLGISDVPQGVAFFSAVDVDHVLRKEVFMTCETPSHPTPIPAGESLDIAEVLEKTGGTLGTAREVVQREIEDPGQPVQLFPDLTSETHTAFLEAQAAGIGAKAKRWLLAQPPLKGDKVSS
ncbi:putative gamma DNA-directed DNA polymerase [Dioszegia hungarica]|uniref:Mitochondrial DNA polymerase catalytic subunit n=1 Tax=Dioszegia hungarica TaxID=4972 RepID=A0AA38LXD6_9TREE|nr:putative gamma DNA-directed DNA polymerase [Dioszegia hungarica]KAI9638443.1 putative gamma DNA-directed DNA polymerase [Dioszegia hungarica]